MEFLTFILLQDTITSWVQLLCPPDTKANETLWSHHLSRGFLGLFALFYHNLTLGTAVDEFCSQTLGYFAFWLLTSQFLAISRCLPSSGGKSELQWCLLHTDDPPGAALPINSSPLWDFQLHSALTLSPLNSFPSQTGDGRC